MASKYEALKTKLANWKEKGQETLGSVLQTVEVGGTAFAFGFMRGKMGDTNGDLDVVGVPASLGTGILMHGLGFMGVFGKHSEHAHNVGDGAIAEYAAVQGMRMGRARSDVAPGTKTIAGQRAAGRLPVGGQTHNPFGARTGSFGGFNRNAVANPFVRAA